MLEVKTTNGSRVRPKMAGTESTAKTMSVISRKSKAMKSGVAWRTPVLADEEALAVEAAGHRERACGTAG